MIQKEIHGIHGIYSRVYVRTHAHAHMCAYMRKHAVDAVDAVDY
jgi:hypothetical protein